MPKRKLTKEISTNIIQDEQTKVFSYSLRLASSILSKHCSKTEEPDNLLDIEVYSVNVDFFKNSVSLSENARKNNFKNYFKKLSDKINDLNIAKEHLDKINNELAEQLNLQGAEVKAKVKTMQIAIADNLADAYFDVASALRGEYFERAFLNQNIFPNERENIILLAYDICKSIFSKNEVNNENNNLSNTCYSNSHVKLIVEFYSKAIEFYELSNKLDKKAENDDSICFAYYQLCEVCERAYDKLAFVDIFEKSFQAFCQAESHLPVERREEYRTTEGNNISYTQAVEKFQKDLMELKKRLNVTMPEDMEPDLSGLSGLAEASSAESASDDLESRLILNLRTYKKPG